MIASTLNKKRSQESTICRRRASEFAPEKHITSRTVVIVKPLPEGKPQCEIVCINLGYVLFYSLRWKEFSFAPLTTVPSGFRRDEERFKNLYIILDLKVISRTKEKAD